jgi:pyruvate ferredoxin oxidoreductase delta subunit
VATDTKKEITKEAGWRDLPIGGILEQAGSAAKYLSGDWRVERPIWDAEKCINCHMCWVYCPDSSINTDEEGKVIGIDYDHCKGCGICAAECPPKANAIVMAPESDYRDK